MSENIRIQSELNTDLEVYRLKGELLQLREQNRVLRGWLGKALDRAREHNEGCLYCGEGEIIDGETTPEHRAECWWYRAQAALTVTSQPGGAHEL